MFTKSLVLPAIFVLASSIATPGLAEQIVQQRRIVTIDRAELVTAEGRARIDAKIARAVRLVCGPTNRHSLVSARDMIDCRNNALADARRQLDQRVAAARGTIEIAVVTSAPSPR